MEVFNNIVSDSTIQGPAAVNLETRDLFINPNEFPQLPPPVQRLVLLHEAGHIVNDSRNEFNADDYAFARWMGEGGSCYGFVKALREGLGENKTEQHYQRISDALNDALLFDHEYNNNPEALELYKELNGGEPVGVVGAILTGVSAATGLTSSILGLVSQKRNAATQEQISTQQYNAAMANAQNEARALEIEKQAQETKAKNLQRLIIGGLVAIVLVVLIIKID